MTDIYIEPPTEDLENVSVGVDLPNDGQDYLTTTKDIFHEELELAYVNL